MEASCGGQGDHGRRAIGGSRGQEIVDAEVTDLPPALAKEVCQGVIWLCLEIGIIAHVTTSWEALFMCFEREVHAKTIKQVVISRISII